MTDHDTAYSSAREKFLGLSLESTRKSYYPQLQMHLEAARDNERQLQLLIDSIPARISYVNAEERFVFVNLEYEKVFGLKREQIVGKRLEEILGQGNYGKIEQHLRAALRGQQAHFAYSFTDRHGESRWLEVTFVPNICHGSVNGFYVLGVDLTERKRAEEERERLQAQLIQAQKMEAIGKLAGGVAHDLNNLLFPILGYSEMMLEDAGLDGQQREAIAAILHAGFRARDLVRQLLAFSRRQTLEYKPLDLNRAVANFEKLLRRTIREDIEISILPSPDLPLVMADIGQVEQVLMNLVVNAQDAMPDGGRLTIKTAPAELDEHYAAIHRDVKPGAYVQLIVSDTGCGMDKETSRHLFEPFFSTKGDKGTGLGLATVYGIVKQHDGHIWVYSEAGKGTTIKVYLPLSAKAAPEGMDTEKNASGLRGTETVLLVEDDEQARRLTRAMLERQGYTVLTAETGSIALLLLEKHEGPLHLLLTDVILPGINGRELSALIAERYPDLKVLYMSGYTDNVIVHHGVLAKGINFIEKPFTINTLAAKIRNVLA
jgi:PAS domain S-box-containing protein